MSIRRFDDQHRSMRLFKCFWREIVRNRTIDKADVRWLWLAASVIPSTKARQVGAEGEKVKHKGFSGETKIIAPEHYLRSHVVARRGYNPRFRR
jgi:hypothetical protein